jgi:hypothetical protein
VPEKVAGLWIAGLVIDQIALHLTLHVRLTGHQDDPDGAGCGQSRGADQKGRCGEESDVMNPFHFG